MLSTITRIVMRGRWLFLVLWIGIAVGVTFVAPNLSDEANKSQQAANAQASNDATRATNLIAQEFPQIQETMNNSVTVTFYRKSGLTTADAEYGKALEQFLNGRRSAIHLKSIASPFSNPQDSITLLSKDKQAALLSLDINFASATKESGKWLDDINLIIPKLRHFLSTNSHEREGAPGIPLGLQVNLTAGNAVSQEIIELQNASLDQTLIMTIVFILAVLLIVYRSPIAAIVPLIGVILALFISQGVIAFAASVGVSVSPNLSEFLIVVSFGAGTDYCMLIISRFKENILDGKGKKEALLIAVPSAGEAIVSSACAVIVAFSCMGFAKDFGFRAIGPGLAIAIFIELVVIMTLVPAVIAVVGEKIFWPFLPSKTRTKRLQKESEGYSVKISIWEKVAASVTAKPTRYILCTIVLLLPFVLVLQNFRYDNNELTALLPVSTDSYRGLDVISKHFGQGGGAENAVTIIIKSNEDIWSSKSLRIIEDVAGNFDKIKGVSKITTATRPTGVKMTLQELQKEAQVLSPSKSPLPVKGVANSPGADDISIFELPGDVLQQYSVLKPYMQEYISQNGQSILLNVTLAYDPYSDASLATITEIRNAVKFTLQGTDLKNATVYVGGVTAQVKDNLDTQSNDFVFIIIIVLIATYVILALLLRSLAMPLYMVGTIVLGFAATMGITFATFKYGFGYGGVWPDAPVVVFVILVALGIDYNIFLMARVKEEYYVHEKPTREAVRSGLASTGSIITSCGIIMAGTFSPFLLSGIRTFIEMGFGIIVGLILDTFVIRTLLVPAIAVKVGELNWWPRKRIRITSEDRKKKEEDYVFKEESAEKRDPLVSI